MTEINDKRIVDIDITSIKDTMEMLNIEFNKKTFLKVVKLFHHFISEEL